MATSDVAELTNLRISDAACERLRCPMCTSKLVRSYAHFSCVNNSCRATFPTIDGIPIIIDDNSSVFSTADFISRRQTTQPLTKSFKSVLKRFLPRLGMNVNAKRNYRRLVHLLLTDRPTATILVVGGRILGDGTEELLAAPQITLVETDVSYGPRTQLISDAHEIPFQDATFDAVVVQAVLQCVADPPMCVAEIYRVLKDSGLVYAEAPFMHQVVDGAYDFTRFTHQGLRRLFRRFAEVSSGAACGPAAALALSLQFFLLTFFQSKIGRAIVRAGCQLSLFWLKYFDYFLIHRRGAFESAAGFYFMGKKSPQTVSDRDLVSLYRGPL